MFDQNRVGRRQQRSHGSNDGLVQELKTGMLRLVEGVGSPFPLHLEIFVPGFGLGIYLPTAFIPHLPQLPSSLQYLFFIDGDNVFVTMPRWRFSDLSSKAFSKTRPVNPTCKPQRNRAPQWHCRPSAHPRRLGITGGVPVQAD